MNDPGLQALVDQSTLRDRIRRGDLPDWAALHYGTFRETMLDDRNGEPFPCYFGIESERQGDALYTFVPSTTHPDALLRFRDTLLEYVEEFSEFSERASLVAFFKPPDEQLTEAEYHEQLWHILQFLHVHDPEPWPERIPTDPDDPHWEFSFGGEPMFPTTRAPFYDRRMSRYCPLGLEITFQPRKIFEGITADTEAGQQAREVIQRRIEAYDGVCPHADIGDWGVDGEHEWHQYMLSADSEQAPGECPMTVSRVHPKVDPELLKPRAEA
ncbi:YqcI/YcgG family protein [Haloprofundus salinisoli]|uniref:YqcI/YcgG family protein n=1 Tax=Haloprofundus salinisoli TaxID=2876193 RepID=UPI001CCD5CDB|nr:YqcI/YcgG family protein [Haloprofundus salinisoli]